MSEQLREEFAALVPEKLAWAKDSLVALLLLAYHGGRDNALAQIGELVTTASAVIERWEQPTWKDVPATANYIYAMRDAINTLTKGEQS